ncbi:MAG: response regulator transcription factor [Pirellula sp.]
MPTKVLLVEDDPALSDAVREGLTDEHIDTVVVSNVKDGLEQIRTQRPDAVVLDLMLAGESGFDLLRTVRSQRDQTPILIISALGTTEHRVNGLMAGADDYLVKPFELKELYARIVANIRRNQQQEGPVLTFGPLRMELTTRRAFREGKELRLSPTEISLLELFIRHENQVLSRKMLYHQLWESNWESETNVIEVHINRLRSKVDRGFTRALIHTVRGRGYMFSENPPQGAKSSEELSSEPQDSFAS